MRWIIRAVLALFILVAVAVVVILLIPSERIARVAATQFEAATGREMTISGEVRPSVWPELGVSTGPVSLANASWSEAGPMFSAEGLSIGVDLASLFGGDVRVRRIEAIAPRILLERAADGRANWEFETASDPAPDAGPGDETEAPPLVVTLDLAEIKDAAVSYIDRVSGQRAELSGLDAVIRMPEADGPVDITASATVNGQPFETTLRLGSATELAAGGVVALAADVAAAGSTARFDGRVGLQPAAEGRLEADLGDLDRLFALAGMAPPDLPPGVGERIAVAGDITYTETTFNLRSANVTLDENTATVSADVTLTERPALTARITAGALDLSRFTGGDSGDGAAGSGGDWPRDTIDVSALQALDANILISAESLDLGVATLAPFETLTKLDAGRAVTELQRIGAYGGSFTGSVVVNSRGGLSLRTNVRGDGVALKPLMTQFAGFDRLDTTGDVTLNILGVGNSVHALVNGLSGDGAISFGAGEFFGLDLVGMIRNMDFSYVGPGTKTIFDTITGTFTIQNGVLTNPDLNIAAPLFNATGEGQLGIGAQTLDYAISPKLFEGQEIVVPVRIAGPWSAPRFSLDLQRAAEGRLREEAERLREEAEQKVLDTVSKELGLELQEGESIRDTLERGVQDEIREGIGNLLGGGLLGGN